MGLKKQLIGLYQIMKQQENKKKIGLITGITGQDGSYLAEFLLEKGYEVHGIIRRSSYPNTERIDHIFNKLHLHYGDITDASVISSIISKVKPDEIYNLAAQSHVQISFEMPQYTGQVDAIGTLNILEAVKNHSQYSKTYHACLDEKTQIVTKNGIKNYNEINIEDEVLSYNLNTKKSEFKKVLKKYEYNIEEDIVVLKNKRINQVLTKNHKMIVKLDGDKDEYIFADDLKKHLKYEKTSHINMVLPKPADGIKSDYIDLKQFVDFNKMSQNNYKNIFEFIKTDVLFYLIGLYIGDGYIKKAKTNYKKSNRNFLLNSRHSNGRFKGGCETDVLESSEGLQGFVEFAIPVGDKTRTKFVNFLNKNNISFIEHSQTISISSYPLCQIFKMCGIGFENKKIPSWMFDYSCEHLKHLKEGIVDSDGNYRKTKFGFREFVTTSSKYLINDLIILSYKLGIFCSYSFREPKTSFSKKLNRHIIGRKKSYIFSFNQRKTNKIYKNNITTKNYKGLVWCLEVEDNHNFLIVRDGKIAFTGNSTSELFGGLEYNRPKNGYNEESSFHPRSPYGVAKLYGYWISKNYREAYNMFISNGILFNHGSSRRGVNFIEKKIVDALVNIKFGKQDSLYIGNLYAKRDIGYAKEYIEGMWLMLQQEKAEDFVLSTNETYTIKEMINISTEYLGIEIEWVGEGLDEIAVDKKTGKTIVQIDEKYLRPSEVDLLIGDSSKAKEILGWEAKTKLPELLKLMIDEKMLKNTSNY